MLTSQLALARKLHEKAKFYAQMRSKLHDYPGYDAVLEVDAERLMIGRAEALNIIDNYEATNNEAMTALGLEFDE